MYRKLVFILFIAAATFTTAQNKKIYEMTNSEIDNLLRVTSEKDLTVTERMNMYSEMFLGMPYNLTCAGEGPYALLETEPLVNFTETNCMVFCEHVLAMSLSDSWDNFFNNLQQIRYQNGIIGMRTRNHYTMADWLPENKWLLHDVTREIGGGLAKSTTRTISHKKFFEGKGIEDLRYIKPDRKLTVDYIPLENLSEIKDRLKPGDVLALIFKDKDNIFSAHMLMIAEKDGELYVRESSNSKMTTFDTTYDEWVNQKQGSTRYAGLSFMRVNEDIDQPGKVILPWEVVNYR